MNVISLGWGTQSWALAAMSALGVLPKVDLAIHADTGRERSTTYDFAERWTPWLEERGIPVVTVRPSRATGPVGEWPGVYIPAFTAGGGMLRRQCTYDWKIAPIRRWLQQHREGGQVELWIGITFDEVQRMKDSDVKYITHRHPFLERERPLRRSDVVMWLQQNGLEVPDRSACYMCPYQSNREWRSVKERPEDWQKAVAFDEAIREKRPPFPLYLHASRQPLVQIDLDPQRDQMPLFDNECEGMCGV